MARPLTGSCKPLEDGRWRAGIPVERGSSQRRTATFNTQAAATAWLAACVDAIENDGHLPDPETFRRAAIRRTPAPADQMDLRTYALAWHYRLYEANHYARGKRTGQTLIDINNHILDYFDVIGITRPDEITPEAATDLARYLGGWPLAYYEASRPKASPLAQSTAERVIGLFGHLMVSAVGDGAIARNPAVKIKAMVRYGDELHRDQQPPLTLEQMAAVAAYLPPIYQLVAWMMRLLGLRIGEAFGPRVGDLIDDGQHMMLIVERQGGQTSMERDKYGRWVRSSESKQLKTKASYRVMPVPACLAEIVRIIIDAYHTPRSGGGCYELAELL